MNGFPPEYAFGMSTEHKRASYIIVNELKSEESGNPQRFNFNSEKWESRK